MTWRDDLKRVTLADGRRLIGASFRGVPFLVEGSERSGGRRTEVHEFPFRDDPQVDDLGRRARTFQVEGYVIGENYIPARDLLLEALEDVEGPGELVHPYHGIRRAVCTGVTVRESNRDGGMAMFAIEFAEAPAQSARTNIVPDFAQLVDVAATASLEAVSEDMEADYDTDGLPSWAVQSSADYLSDVADDLEQKLAPLAATTQELAELTAALELLRVQATSLVREPADTITAFMEALETLADATEDEPAAFVSALLEVYNGAVMDLATATTATRERERANQEALMGAIRRILLGEAARLAALATYESLDEALDVRDAVLEAIDEQAETAGDSSYPALVELRARVVDAVPGDAALARVVTVTRNVTVPSILLAFQLYGSVDQEDDIVARNNAEHPGFLSGELEVLSDA